MGKAKQKSYAFTDLGNANLRLEVNGIKYPVTQYSANFALNEIPAAQCYLAVGRRVNGLSFVPATVDLGKLLTATQMTKAKVHFSPKGEYSPDGTEWPNKGADRIIFDGYLAGIATRKVTDKFIVVVNLIHWLIDLDCSSTLTKHGHAANPTQLNVAAVHGKIGSAGAGMGDTIGRLAGADLVKSTVMTDVWASIKLLYCRLASLDTQPPGSGSCGGDGEFSSNDRASLALARIEGPAGAGGPLEGGADTKQTESDKDCSIPYSDGVPLALDIQKDGGAGIFDATQEAVAKAISEESVDAYSAATFWQKLVSGFCPAFGMAVVPMVQRAIVIADLPGYRGGVWREIVDEYDSLDFSAALERPLRGVGVVGKYATMTMFGVEEDGEGAPPIGGCWVADSVAPGDGAILFVSPPPWLSAALLSGSATGETTGTEKDEPGRAAGADAVGPKPVSATKETLATGYNALYTRYAHLFFVNNMLRGRTGSISGKLRFDIAPGSMLRIKARPEPFVAELSGGVDTLSATMIGCVSRVTVAISAEGPSAVTAFELTHMRVEDPENKNDRTSVIEHPLFGKSIHGAGKYGSTLVKALSPALEGESQDLTGDL